MASYKEEIYIQYSDNYNQAISNLNAVKQSLTDNVYEVDKLNQAQYQLTDKFKKFESALNASNDETKEAVQQNDLLNIAIKNLDKSFDSVNPAIERYNGHLKEVATNADKADKAVDKANKSTDNTTTVTDKASEATDKLTTSTKDLTDSTKASTAELVNAGGVFEFLDSVTFGVSSKVRDFVQAQGGLGTVLKGNAVEFAAMSKSAQVATVAINGTKLALKALMVASIIGGLLVALSTVVENWEDIIKQTRMAFDENYKLYTLEQEKIKLQRESLINIDEQTEQMRRAGFTELEILQAKQKQILDNIGLLVRENQLKRENEARELTFIQNMEVGLAKIQGGIIIVGAMIYSFFEGIADGISSLFGFGRSKFEESTSDMLKKQASDAFKLGDTLRKQNQVEYESSEEYKKYLKDLEKERENYARTANQIDKLKLDSKKKTNKDTKKEDDKELEQQKARLETLRKLEDKYRQDIAKLAAGDDVIKKQILDIDVKIYESNEKLKDSMKTLLETYKEGSKEYLESKKLFEELNTAELSALKAEKEAIEANKDAFTNVNDAINLGQKPRKEALKDIEAFLKTIENSEAKDYFSKMFGYEALSELETFMEAYKAEWADFGFDEQKTIDENASQLELMRSHNQAILEEEKRMALEQADLLNASEEDKQKIREKFKKEEVQLERDYQDAATDLNKKRADQTQGWVDAAGAGIDALGEMFSDNFEVSKGLAVAGAVIDTYSAIVSTLKAYSGQPIPGYAIAMAAVTGIAGFMSVQKILATTPENASASGAGGGAAIASMEASAKAPNNTFLANGQSQLAQTINGQTDNQPVVNAVVSSKDIKNNLELNLQKISNSSL